MASFELDPDLSSRCEPETMAELLAALEDLNHAPCVCARTCEVPAEALRIRLSLYTTNGAGIKVLGPCSEAPLAATNLLWASLKPHLAEYHDVIQRIVQVGISVGDARFETLDWAKKVVHDEAGEALAEALEAFLELDLPTARRLFTVLFLMKTELPAHLVRYHRSHL